jgi:O-antigen/teichoic acid export membrane protein
MKQQPPVPLNPKKALMTSAFWAVGMRWVVKATGFINTLIVARLVEPQDYGLVAMAFLVVGLIQAVLDFGSSTALLRMAHLTREDTDSAWSLTVIEGACCGLLLLALSPLAARYFQEPRLVYVLWVMAACQVVSGLSNVGLVLARKEFQFSIDFNHMVGIKLFSVLFTIAAAYVFHDYRALMTGVIAGNVSGLLLSYWLHPYRPRWNTTKIPEIWALTKWLMLAGVGGFFLRKSDELIAARIGSTREFGLYNVGADLGQLPTGELGPAMLRAFLPVLSSIQTDITRTNQAVLKTLSAVNTITLPVGLGFAAVAAPVTELVLGAKWLEAIPFVACFALAGALQFAMSPLTTLLVLRGHTRLQSHIVWVEFAAFVVMALALVPHMHLLGLVWARIAASGVNAWLTAGSARKYCALPLRALAEALVRPLLGAVLMYGLVTQVAGLLPGGSWSLAVSIGLGALAYTGWTLITWRLAGRPEGLESTVLDHIARRREARSSGAH